MGKNSNTQREAGVPVTEAAKGGPIAEKVYQGVKKELGKKSGK
ncbi:hypothetical protein [Amycolatopsis sp. NPDC058986]